MRKLYNMTFSASYLPLFGFIRSDGVVQGTSVQRTCNFSLKIFTNFRVIPLHTFMPNATFSVVYLIQQ